MEYYLTILNHKQEPFLRIDQDIDSIKTRAPGSYSDILTATNLTNNFVVKL